MKVIRAIILFVFVFMFIISVCNAGEKDWNVEAGISHTIFSSETISIENGTGVWARLSIPNGLVDTDFFFQLSRDSGLMKYSGQELGVLDITGLSFGVGRSFWNDFKVRASVGYYIPDGKCKNPAAAHEALLYYTNHQTSPFQRVWTHYDHTLSPAVGFDIGIDYNHVLFKNFFINTGLGYRYLKFPEVVHGYDTYVGDFSTGWWEFFNTLDAGGVMFRFGFEYKF